MQQATFKYETEVEGYSDEYGHYYAVLENVTAISVSCECPHCNAFSTMSLDSSISRPCWRFDLISHCPNCGESVFIQTEYNEKENLGEVIAIYPNSRQKIIIPDEIPEKYAKDFKEATLILDLSPKASAALSRRILQNILREEYKIQDRSLAKEIDSFISLPHIPQYLSQAIDAIRNVGNIAAHPLKDTNTGEIVDIEPGEAEWLLEVLDSLFDFTFIQPQKLAKRRRELNTKLQSLGQPPMKG